MKQIQTKVLVRSKYVNFNCTEYKDKLGNTREWYWSERPNGERAVVIAATVEDKLVVITEYRVPAGRIVWDIPAGLIDKDELPEEAATRELKEETGLSVVKIDRVTPFLYSSPGINSETACIVYVQAEGEISSEDTEPSEVIKTFLMDRDQVKRLLVNINCTNSPMAGAKAYFVFDHFARYGKF